MRKTGWKKIVAAVLITLMIIPQDASLAYAATENDNNVQQANALTENTNAVLEVNAETENEIDLEKEALNKPVGGLQPKTGIKVEDDVEPDESSSEEIICRAKAKFSSGSESSDSIYTKTNTNYAYKVLTDSQKQFYNKLDQYIPAFQDAGDVSITEFSNASGYIIARVNYSDLGLSDEDAIKTYCAYDFDHPSYYWMSNTYLYTGTTFIILTEEEYAKKSERTRISALIENGVKEYAALTNGYDKNIDKIAIIHDKIVSEVDYAYKNNDGVTPETKKWAHSAHGVFDDNYKKVVCEGYAETFTLIMNYLGIPNYYITGTAGSGGSGGGGRHSWNAVYDDSIQQYIYMDLTWDDLGGSEYYYLYFGMPKSLFEQSHIKHSSSGTGINWTFDPTGTFNNDINNSYYGRSLFTGTDVSQAQTFVNNIKTNNCRYGKRYTFSTIDFQEAEDRVKILGQAMKIEEVSYRYITIDGKKYYLLSYNLGNNETIDLSNAEVTLDSAEYGYSSSGVEPKPTVTLNGVKLVEGVNYTLSYSNNTQLGTNTAKVTVTGKGNFSGSCEKAFSIVQNIQPLTEQMVTLSADTFTYNKASQKPSVTVKDGSTTLTKDSDYTVTYSDDTTNAGQKTVTVTGKQSGSKGYSGSVTLNYTINPDNLSDSTVTLSENSKTYTGMELMPDVTAVINDNTALVEDKDYTVSYDDNVNAGSDAKVVIKGTGNYTGTCNKTFTINQANISETTMSLSQISYTHDGEEKKPEASLTYKGKTLVQGTDYNISYSSNVDKGTASCIASGTGNFIGTKTAEFVIVTKSIADAEITLTPDTFVYNGSDQTPEVTVVLDGTTLTAGENYTLSYNTDDRDDVGIYSITITGTGQNVNNVPISGSTVVEYSIDQKAITTDMITVNDSNLTYDGTMKEPTVTIKDGSTTLVKGTDYTVTYDNNVAAGSTAKAIVKGKGNYKGEATKTFTISPINISGTKITVNDGQLVYDGNAQKPEVSVMYNSAQLVQDRDYTVGYSNNVNAGEDTATVIVTGKGNFAYAKTEKFSIDRRNVTVKADDLSKKVGDSDPTLTADVTGLVGSDTVKYEISREEGEEIGSYKITVSGEAKQGNYEVSYVNGTFKIKKNADDPDDPTPGKVISVDEEAGTAVIYDDAAGGNATVPLAVITAGQVYRMYDANRGEHFYTKSAAEAEALMAAGWTHESNADFTVVGADEEDATPIYRLYNPNGGGMHFYTASSAEALNLKAQGWGYEGISHYVYAKGSSQGTAQYRLYNPNSPNGEHNWTTDIGERNMLIAAGWTDEGVAWNIK
ncbi:MAG: hypothetical protein K5644_08285 [Lachnospiraceae bacterium]|nr:hypothetical protein [Lachnospiraceae bacterium]